MEVHILRTMDATKWQKKNCTSAEIIVNTLSTEVRWGICSTKPIIRQYQRHFSCRLSIVRVLVSLPGKRAGTLFPTVVWDFSLYQREQTGFGAHPPSDLVISWDSCRSGRAAEAWDLTPHPPNLVPRLRISGVTHIFPLYDFMAYRGATMPLPSTLILVITPLILLRCYPKERGRSFHETFIPVNETIRRHVPEDLKLDTLVRASDLTKPLEECALLG
jgi:hypothetical protein